jgi:2-methylcitrate dehydratase
MQKYDPIIGKIADYVVDTQKFSDLAYETASLCLQDAMACAHMAEAHPECTRILYEDENDPVHAAFNLGTKIRWLDYNDTWLAKEWGHPSDNIGAIMAVGNHLKDHELLQYIIKAYEIQGVLALDNAFNQYGIDHVILVKLASAAVCMHIMGGDKDAVKRVISQVFIDGQALRTYRHAPNTGSRKSWAAGDACARAIRLCQLVEAGEMGYPTAITCPRWGFEACTLRGDKLRNDHDFGCYVIENILFKVAYPAEFHAQTAVEAALQLHAEVAGRLAEIEGVEIFTTEAGDRIINKTGPLHNYADRDHCLQFMVAVGLIYGELTAESYSDVFAQDARIDALREKMSVAEDAEFTRMYFDSEKRAIPNRVQVFFKDGSSTDVVQVDYPLGHRFRREEALPLLREKFE